MYFLTSVCRLGQTYKQKHQSQQASPSHDYLEVYYQPATDSVNEISKRKLG